MRRIKWTKCPFDFMGGQRGRHDVAHVAVTDVSEYRYTTDGYRSLIFKNKGYKGSVLAVLYSSGKRYLESVRKWIFKSDTVSFLETAFKIFCGGFCRSERKAECRIYPIGAGLAPLGWQPLTGSRVEPLPRGLSPATIRTGYYLTQSCAVKRLRRPPPARKIFKQGRRMPA